ATKPALRKSALAGSLVLLSAKPAVARSNTKERYGGNRPQYHLQAADCVVIACFFWIASKMSGTSPVLATPRHSCGQSRSRNTRKEECGRCRHRVLISCCYVIVWKRAVRCLCWHSRPDRKSFSARSSKASIR